MVVQADGVMYIQGEMNSERQVVWWLGKNEASWRKEYRYKGSSKYFGDHRIGH